MKNSIIAWAHVPFLMLLMPSLAYSFVPSKNIEEFRFQDGNLTLIDTKNSKQWNAELDCTDLPKSKAMFLTTKSEFVKKGITLVFTDESNKPMERCKLLEITESQLYQLSLLDQIGLKKLKLFSKSP